MTFLTRLSIAEILNKYDFTQEEQEYINNDFNRGPNSRRQQTTKQLLANKKHELSKHDQKTFMNDLTPYVPPTTFYG